jgi:hypothetical protein
MTSRGIHRDILLIQSYGGLTLSAFTGYARDEERTDISPLIMGTQSPWVSRLITALGHTALVANARKVKAVTSATRKSDAVDAETLARLGRADPALLAPLPMSGLRLQIAPHYSDAACTCASGS